MGVQKKGKKAPQKIPKRGYLGKRSKKGPSTHRGLKAPKKPPFSEFSQGLRLTAILDGRLIPK